MNEYTFIGNVFFYFNVFFSHFFLLLHFCLLSHFEKCIVRSWIATLFEIQLKKENLKSVFGRQSFFVLFLCGHNGPPSGENAVGIRVLGVRVWALKPVYRTSKRPG